MDRCGECGALYASHHPDTDKPAGSREWRGCPPDLWAVEAGRGLTFDGVLVCNIIGSQDATGYRYIPAYLDDLTRDIAAALNAAHVDGSKVLRR